MVGSWRAHEVFRKAGRGKLSITWTMERIHAEISATPHLWPQSVDCDIWDWVRRLDWYSPILHLQQSNGKSSLHRLSTERYNEIGVAQGEELIDNLHYAFSTEREDEMPDSVEEIVLTLEPFVGTAANSYMAMDEIAEPV